VLALPTLGSENLGRQKKKLILFISLYMEKKFPYNDQKINTKNK